MAEDRGYVPMALTGVPKEEKKDARRPRGRKRVSLWSTIQVSGCQGHGGPTNVPWNARVPPSFRVEQTPEWAIGDRMGEKS